jgi:arylsulfatase A-like enzyme
MGCAGDPNVHTPNLDRMASTGMRFHAAVAGCPLCSPFRGSLLAGRYPHHCVPGHEYLLPPDQPTVAHAFKQAGYRTSYFGKWHVDGYHERDGRAGLHVVPPDRRGGFDEWLGYENNNSQWDCWVAGNAGEGEVQFRLPGFETDALTDIVIDYIRRRGAEAKAGNAKPFFAALSVQPPHDPYVAPEEWMRRHTPGALQLRPNVPNVPRVVEWARRTLAGYYAQIENLDWNVGRIRAALAAAGLEENTYIMFFSDHGDLHGSNGQFMKTSPLEESLRIPFIISKGPGRYGHREGVCDAPINHVDIAPTSLGLAGIAKPEWMEGFDYSGYFVHGKEVKDAPDSAFCQLVVPTGHAYSVDRPWRAVVTRDGWKYAVVEHQPMWMFNLNDDPYEQANLAFNKAFRVQRKRLHERLVAWMDQTGDKDFVMPKGV